MRPQPLLAGIEPEIYSHQLTTAVIDTVAGFRALRREWDELLCASTSDRFFLTWEWLYTWWTHLRDDRNLHIITTRHDGRLVAIAPLAFRPRRWRRLMPFPVLEFLGCGNVGSDYLGIFVRTGYEDAALRALAGCLTESDIALELSHVDRQNPLMTNFALQLRQLGWHDHRATIEFCPYVKLDGHTWESFLAALGSTHRTNFRRKLKKLNARYTLRIEEAASDAERRAALEILIALHLKRRDEIGGSDALHKRELLDFHEDLTGAVLQRNWLRLQVMWLDDKPVAAMYGFVYDNVFYFYQSGFDMDYGDYSVGLVMLGLVIKGAIEGGIREFDLLHGQESYKYLWAGGERELVRYTFFPPHTRGSLCSQLMQARRVFKRMLTRLQSSRRGALPATPAGRFAARQDNEKLKET